MEHESRIDKYHRDKLIKLHRAYNDTDTSLLTFAQRLDAGETLVVNDRKIRIRCLFFPSIKNSRRRVVGKIINSLQTQSERE